MTSWKNHPNLPAQFSSDGSDELQVIAHDGGATMTDRRPELVSVRVTAFDGEVFTGRVLHQPIQLRTVHLGQQIRFIFPDGATQPVMVTEKYLLERPAWTIEPCEKCGFSELFDAPSDLIRLAFPNARNSSTIHTFKCCCPRCGGTLKVLAKPPTAAPAVSQKSARS